jgi:negative regulator of sigma E activity
MSDAPLPEPLDDFLQHPPSAPMAAQQRDALFRKTASMLPKPRWRRWPVAAAVAAAVLLALVSLWRATREPNIEPVDPPPHTEQKVEPKSEPPKPAVVVAPTHPREVEWSAFDAEDDHTRARLYFQAGNLYLSRDNDVDSALRCYHQALRYGDAAEREIDTNDNWLVLALKHDFHKER